MEKKNGALVTSIGFFYCMVVFSTVYNLQDMVKLLVVMTSPGMVSLVDTTNNLAAELAGATAISHQEAAMEAIPLEEEDMGVSLLVVAMETSLQVVAMEISLLVVAMETSLLVVAMETSLLVVAMGISLQGMGAVSRQEGVMEVNPQAVAVDTEAGRVMAEIKRVVQVVVVTVVKEKVAMEEEVLVGDQVDIVFTQLCTKQQNFRLVQIESICRQPVEAGPSDINCP